jgi:hypothetical protein
MGQKRALNHGRVVSLLAAGVVGYLLGGWHVTALRGTILSPSQSVALRFPVGLDDDAQAVTAVSAAMPDAFPATPAVMTASASAMGQAQLALLNPESLVTQASVTQASLTQTPVAQASVTQASVTQASVTQELTARAPQRMAAVEDVAAPPAPVAAPPERTPAAGQNTRETRPAPMLIESRNAAVPVHRRIDRPGFVLNDNQIASIKRRLNLTPDQEQMWPAVEAALRNIAYTTAREAHRRGAPASTGQLASANPNSAEVQDLKSAAIPLIMSFNSEQKDEVRSLAHVMGLDQLASQF